MGQLHSRAESRRSGYVVEAMTRRVYYDHEPAYRAIERRGGRGWDDRADDPDTDSYVGLDAFIAEYCAERTLAAVLDLGCGGGQAALRFSARADRVVGIDYSETAVALARSNAAGLVHVHFEVGDVTRLDGVDGPFDVIVDNHALHCLVDDDHRQGMLRGVAGLLAPRGLFFCETMSREGRFDPERFDVGPPGFVDAAKTRRWVSAAELDAELESAGLVIVERRQRAVPPGAPPSGDLLWTVARARTRTV